MCAWQGETSIFFVFYYFRRGWVGGRTDGGGVCVCASRLWGTQRYGSRAPQCACQSCGTSRRRGARAGTPTTPGPSIIMTRRAAALGKAAAGQWLRTVAGRRRWSSIKNTLLCLLELVNEVEVKPRFVFFFLRRLPQDQGADGRHRRGPRGVFIIDVYRLYGSEVWPW